MATHTTLLAAQDRLSFFAVGRQGYGNESTQRIAQSMARLAKDAHTDFTVLLGDNFFPVGVSSLKDPQWQSKFENLYQLQSLDMPFHVVLGNHDHAGNPQVQVDYTKHAASSGRWKLPAPFRYETFGEAGARPLVGIVFLDSVPMTTVDNSHIKSREAQLDMIRKSFSNDNLAPPVWKIIASHYPTRSVTRHPFPRKGSCPICFPC